MVQETDSTTMTKDQLRAAFFSSKNKELKKVVIKVFDLDVEIRQPTVGQISRLATTPQSERTPALLRIMVEYCFVPGTDERVFTDADYDQLATMPAGDWLSAFNDAVEQLTGIDVKSAEKN